MWDCPILRSNWRISFHISHHQKVQITESREACGYLPDNVGKEVFTTARAPNLFLQLLLRARGARWGEMSGMSESDKFSNFKHSHWHWLAGWVSQGFLATSDTLLCQQARLTAGDKSEPRLRPFLKLESSWTDLAASEHLAGGRKFWVEKWRGLHGLLSDLRSSSSPNFCYHRDLVSSDFFVKCSPRSFPTNSTNVFYFYFTEYRVWSL